MQDTLITKELMSPRYPGEKGVLHPGTSLGNLGSALLSLGLGPSSHFPPTGLTDYWKILFLKKMQVIQTLMK